MSKLNIQILFLFLSSLMALTFAYMSEYFLKLAPCILCLYQRIPYFIALITSFAVLYLKKIKTYKVLFFFLLLFLIESSMALFHVAIEHGWVHETSSCSSNLDLENKSIEEARRSILESTTSCSKPSILVFNYSMAELNLLYSTLITIYLIFCLLKGKNEKKLTR
jgi:disulfide bond formation protein DsbB